jgi:hypothetical protein
MYSSLLRRAFFSLRLHCFLASAVLYASRLAHPWPFWPRLRLSALAVVSRASKAWSPKTNARGVALHAAAVDGKFRREDAPAKGRGAQQEGTAARGPRRLPRPVAGQR